MKRERYRLILDPTPDTLTEFHGFILASSPKIVQLLDEIPSGYWPTAAQRWHVLDAKTGKVYSKEEYLELRKQLQG